MRICVTGAAGRIGRFACDAVLAAGHDLIATDRRLDPEHPGRIAYADLLDPVACHRVVAGCDSVIHLGNHAGIQRLRPAQVFAENGAVNANLCQAALEQGASRLVFASSIQVVAGPPLLAAVDAGIPSALPYLPLDGEVPPDPGNLYAASKAAGEDLLRACAHQAPQVAWIAIRLPCVATRLWNRGAEPHVGHLRDELFTVIQGEDAARLLLAAATRSAPGYHCYQAGSRDLTVDLPLEQVVATWWSAVPLRAGRDSLDAPVDLEVLATELGWEPRPIPWPVHDG